MGHRDANGKRLRWSRAQKRATKRIKWEREHLINALSTTELRDHVGEGFWPKNPRNWESMPQVNAIMRDSSSFFYPAVPKAIQPKIYPIETDLLIGKGKPTYEVTTIQDLP